MTNKEYDALWWQYFAECGSSCGLPLPTRIPETIGVICGYIATMLQAFGASSAAGNLTAKGFFEQLAFRAPAAYLWVAKVFPQLLRVAGSTFVSGAAGLGRTGTMQLAGRSLVASEVGAVGAGMLASAYLGFVVGAAAYASLRIRGFDLGAEGSSASDFFAWQTGNSNLTFMQWYGGAFAGEQQGEDLRLRIARRKSAVIHALLKAENKHRIAVPKSIYSKINAVH